MLLGSAGAQSDEQALSTEQLYRMLSPSVHMVEAAGSLEDFKSRRNISVGSAVAIGAREAITNCHVVKHKPLIVLLRSGGARTAALARADEAADICVLTVADAVLTPVKRIRPYASLATGERIVTIGSPYGLENSLGEGLIAGLRRRNTQPLVQITAQISQGSSGGGLFDRFGNLVGITSFILNEIQTIGFAIAIDEFARVATLPPEAETGSIAAASTGAAAAGLRDAVAAKAGGAGAYRLELAVTRDTRQAEQTWSYLTARYGDLLTGLKPEMQRYETAGKGEFVRLSAGTIAERGRAESLCAALSRRGHATCAVR